MNIIHSGRILVTLILLLALQGCGFKLRGSSSATLPESLSPMLIEGLGGNDATRRQLQSLLLESGLQLTPKRAQAGSVLQLQDRQSKRRVIAIDSGGKVVEYELYESLRFSLSNAAGEALLETQQVTLLRTHLNPEVEVLGKQQEEQILRQEMRKDLADQILRRIAAQLR